ncbi:MULTISPECIES: hypothetical protein [Gemmobacter]|jgi:hypothetical protein|uniref:Transcriptional regulator n=1 Tax=Gemmobacter nanjingensis TaxID=488454 RepID=A0ABQ3FFU9_9RHOB|nr:MULTISPECIES: hypothetical protein [Gemmobacter]OJY31658.1 MAG: hypothetical protein BGP11_08675 [Rhodobacterales bacterium 65-51]GHC22097.1 hypothetical protein GCM10007291_21730 [Gemmobacter nanjingensis]
MSQPDDPVLPSSRVVKPAAKARTAELSREDRLKAALKANMARRKAQARARAAQDDNEKE